MVDAMVEAPSSVQKRLGPKMQPLIATPLPAVARLSREREREREKRSCGVSRYILQSRLLLPAAVLRRLKGNRSLSLGMGRLRHAFYFALDVRCCTGGMSASVHLAVSFPLLRRPPVSRLLFLPLPPLLPRLSLLLPRPPLIFPPTLLLLFPSPPPLPLFLLLVLSRSLCCILLSSWGRCLHRSKSARRGRWRHWHRHHG